MAGAYYTPNHAAAIRCEHSTRELGSESGSADGVHTRLSHSGFWYSGGNSGFLVLAEFLVILAEFLVILVLVAPFQDIGNC